MLKKRKSVYGHQNIDLAPVCEKPLEDESDLDDEPCLINFKLKAPKMSRAKRKFDGRCDHQSSCSKVPTRPVATQPEENVISEDYLLLQVSAEVVPVKVKVVEAYEAGERDCSTTFFADDEGPNGSEQIADQCIEDYGDCVVTNGISYGHLDIEPTLELIPWGGVDQDILPLAIDYGEETLELCCCKSSHNDDILSTDESGEETNLEACHCRIDDIWAIESGEETLEVCSSKSSSHLDGRHLDADPILMLTWDGVDVNLESSDSLDLHPLATESGEEALEVLSCESSHPSNLVAIDQFGEETTKVHSQLLDIQNPDFCSNSSISCTMMSEQSSRSEMDVPEMTTNGLPDEKDQSLVSHDRVCEPSCDLSMSMKIDDTRGEARASFGLTSPLVAMAMTVILLAVGSGVAGATTHPEDDYAILKFLEGLGAVVPPGDPCGPPSWPQVRCVSGRISEISAPAANLTGEISGAYLLRLRSLLTLNLSRNRIGGHFPSPLPPPLTLLDVSSNLLTGDLPSSLGRLQSLSTLYVQDNKLSGSLEILKNLTSLTTLNIEKNLFTGQVPDDILRHQNFTCTGCTRPGRSRGYIVVTVVIVALVATVIIARLVYAARFSRPPPDLHNRVHPGGVEMVQR